MKLTEKELQLYKKWLKMDKIEFSRKKKNTNQEVQVLELSNRLWKKLRY